MDDSPLISAFAAIEVGQLATVSSIRLFAQYALQAQSSRIGLADSLVDRVEEPIGIQMQRVDADRLAQCDVCLGQCDTCAGGILFFVIELPQKVSGRQLLGTILQNSRVIAYGPVVLFVLAGRFGVVFVLAD